MRWGGGGDEMGRRDREERRWGGGEIGRRRWGGEERR
jgi:hypothetical protein